MIPPNTDYQAVAKKVFLATDATKRMKEMSLTPPPSPMIKHTIMGKEFDPSKPQAYVESFAIRRT